MRGVSNKHCLLTFFIETHIIAQQKRKIGWFISVRDINAQGVDFDDILQNTRYERVNKDDILKV